jgi:tetratricopeptide (TPR) repeat protein
LPDRAHAWRLVELAKAERNRGQLADAETHLRQCRAQFPAFGPGAAALADLLGALGRREECHSAWRAVINEFSETMQPWWLVELAKAERNSGQHIEAEAHLQRCRAQFPAFGPAAAALADLLGALGRHEECHSAWRAVINEFSETMQPWWLVELAKAERNRGQHIEAEAHLQRCRAQFPAFGPAAAALADLLGALGRHQECHSAWRAVIDKFPETIQHWWFLRLAASWRALGRNEEAERVLDAMDARFPDLPDKLVRRAEAAANKEDWVTAYDHWAACIERHRHDTKPKWLNGQALALFRLWRVEEALSAWTYLIRCYPEFISGRLSLASAARELGLWSLARQCFSELIDRFPHDAGPEWLAEHARALLYESSEQAAKRAIEELEVKFPESPHGCNLLIEHCYHMRFGVNVLLPQIEAALRRFPNNRALLAEYVRALLASGRQDDAGAVTQDLEASADDHHALISRWRVAMDRDGEGALHNAARLAVSGRDWTPQSGLAVGDFLTRIYSAWANDLALELFDSLDANFPGRAAIICARARTLVALRRNDLALRLIDSLPAICQTQQILELRAWAAFRRDDHAQARRVWRRILSQVYFPALHSAAPELELSTPARDSLLPGGVTAFVNIRNEMAHLPEFLRHHRNIGVGRFVFVDNMSTDDSAAYLDSQPDVILYRTQDAYQTSGTGMRWTNVLLERHGQGGWCLHADADEAFIYPGWETTKLDRLTGYLDSLGTEGVAAFMLDVYPRNLVDEGGKPARHAEYRYYDANYAWIGQVRAPYLQPVGGVRWRLFQVHEMLHKMPLIRHRSGCYLDSHNTTPLRLGQMSALLLHYKLLNLALRFRPSGATAGDNPFMTNRGPDLMRRHVRYAARMAKLLDADLVKRDLTETLTDSLVLADRGLMQAPIDFRRWLETLSSS